MAIVYAKNTGNLIYYVYKFAAPSYGISITLRSGETSMLPNFSNEFQEAVSFLSFLAEHRIKPDALNDAATEFRQKPHLCLRHG